MPPTPKSTRTVNKPVAIAATVTIAGLAAVAAWLGFGGTSSPKVTLAPANSPLVLATHVKVYTYAFTQPDNATAFQLWEDGAPFSIVPANFDSLTKKLQTAQSRVVPLTCGGKHRLNARGLNGAGVGPLGVPQYVTVPAC
jgi:hypothetical protein